MNAKQALMKCAANFRLAERRILFSTLTEVMVFRSKGSKRRRSQVRIHPCRDGLWFRRRASDDSGNKRKGEAVLGANSL